METVTDLQAFLDGKPTPFPNFKAGEICTLRKAPGQPHCVPPRSLWPNIIGALFLAQAMRNTMGVPLTVASGYRPADYNAAVGGTPRSAHVDFKALDLDLPNGSSVAMQKRYYLEACRMYLNLGPSWKMGLGLYHADHGTRIHVDTGKGWRYWKPGYVRPSLESLRGEK